MQVEAGFLALSRGGDAQYRLALLLFDSAAELMMHRSAENLLVLDRWKLQHLASMDSWITRGYEPSPDAASELAEFRKTALSKSQIRAIDRSFDSKAGYLAANGKLDLSVVRVLKKLHQYRNEVYHRDHLRPATLRTSAELYGFIITKMMEQLPPGVVSYPAHMPETIAKYVGDRPFLGFDAQAEIGRQILVNSELSSWERLPGLLSEHAESRIDGVLEDLEFCVDFFGDNWDAAAVLHLVQIQNWKSNPIGAAEARSRVVPIRMATLEAWRTEARARELIADPLAAFSGFADFEDAFETIESDVHDLALAIDAEIQLQIDIARGK